MEEKVNKIIKVLFYLSVLVLLVSCTTTRFEPKEGKTSALVVGRLTAKASGFEYDGDINFNRNYTMGTQLTLKEVRTGKTYEAKTIRRDGLFVFGNLNPSEKYYLYQIKYNIEQSNGWKGWITSTYKPNSFPVSVKPDSVVILGNFNCTITEIAGKIKTNLIDRDIPTDVRYSFMDIYPESKWLSKNWYYKNGLMPKVYSVAGEESQIEYEQPFENVNQEEYDDFLKELMGE
jgi:hypothetical protein